MRKFFLIFIFIFFILFDIKVINAETDTSRFDYRISYGVIDYSFLENNRKIEIMGWSLLDHMDNYGGSGSMHNIKTSMIFYYSDNDNIELSDINAAKDIMTNNYSQTSGDNYYKFNAIYPGYSDKNYSMYAQRCDGPSMCIRSSEVQRNYRDRTCLSDEGCTYYDLDWKLDINMANVIQHFETKNKKNMKMIICSSVTIRSGTKTDCAGFGYRSMNRSGEKRFSVNNREYSYRINDGAKNVEMTAINANTYFNNDADDYVHCLSSTEPAPSGTDGRKFEYGSTYEVLGYGTPKKFKMWSGSGYYNWGRKILLKRGDFQCWGYEAWVSPIVTEGTTVTIPCTNVCEPVSNPTASDSSERNLGNMKTCIGGDCSSSDYEEIHNRLSRFSLSTTAITDSDVSNETCRDYSHSFNGSLKTDKTYYYRISKSDLKNAINNSNSELNGRSFSIYVANSGVKKNGDYYYFPIKFELLYNMTQNVQVNVLKNSNTSFSNNQLVKPGKSFSMMYKIITNLNTSPFDSYTLLFNSTNTNNQNISSLLNKYVAKSTIKVSFDETVPVNGRLYCVNSNGSVKRNLNRDCELENGDVVTSYYTVNVYTFLSQNTVLCTSKNDNTCTYRYNNNFLKNIVNNVIDSNTTSFNSNNITAGFNDSNYYNSANVTRFDVNPGSTSCSVNETNRKECTYKIDKAYFSDNGNGTVAYGSGNDGFSVADFNNDGSKSLYYIPLNMKGGDVFNFKIMANDLSLINGVRIKYSTTCSVVAKANEFTDDPGTPTETEKKKLRYRVVTVNDPFPNNSINTSINWKLYSDEKGLNRIKNSYSNRKNYVTKKMKKIDYDGANYTSYLDIGVNGKSLFINNSRFTTISGKHCTVGAFNDDCDKLLR